MWMFLPVSWTITAMESTDRKRLGKAVIARRVELGMLTTKALAEEAKLSTRMLGDVENGRRDNFSDGAKAQIERALYWDPGSIDKVLAGKEPSVSGQIRDKAGRTVARWTSVEGYDQTELEASRLAYILMDARDLVRSQRGPLNAAIAALLDEAVELQIRRLARSRSGEELLTAESLADAQWFVEQTRESNTIRRQGEIYLADDADTGTTSEQRAESIVDIRDRFPQQVRAATAGELPVAARNAPPGYVAGQSEHGDADGEENQDNADATPRAVARELDEKVLGLLAGLSDIDPSVDLRDHYTKTRKALDPIIDTPEGQLAHLTLAQQVIEDAGLKFEASEIAQNFGKFNDA